MTAAVAKFFFRTSPDRRTADRVLQYVRDFGHGKATIEAQGSVSVLYVHDRRDVDLVRHEFNSLLDTWADLT